MATVQFATRVDQEQATLFREITRALGTTPSDALRMFVSAFVANRGFPYDVRLAEEPVEPFANEDEAMEFINCFATEALNEEW